MDDAIDIAERAARAGGEVAMDSFRRTGLTVREKEGAMDPVSEVDLAVQERVVEVLRDATVDGALVGEEAGLETTIPGSGRAWVIDPIDGTNNYVRGTRPWAVCVGIVDDGEPLGGITHMPAMGDTYAVRDVETRRDTGDGPGGQATRDGTSLSTSDRVDPDGLIVAPIFGLRRRDRPDYRRVTASILARFGDVRQTGSAQSTLAMVASGGLDAAVTTVPLSPWDTVVGVALVRAAGGRVTTRSGERWHHDSSSMVASNGVVHDRVVEAIREAD